MSSRLDSTHHLLSQMMLTYFFGAPDTRAIGDAFTTLLNAATSVGMAAAALFLAWAGFLYMTASGSPRRMESAKDAAFAAIGGLAIVLLAQTIATLVQNALPHPT